jgi:hypothetical protein
MTQVYAALAHVHIIYDHAGTRGASMRNSTSCFIQVSYVLGKPRYVGYVWGRNPSALFWD